MTTFQIDGSDVKDPITFTYSELFSPFANSYGQMIVSAFYEATASFNVLTTAQFAAWQAADDGAVHTIRCPAPDTNTYTTYSGVIIEYTGSGISIGLSYYNSTFRVKHLSTNNLGAFGSF